MNKKRDIGKTKRPPPKKKMGCLPKLIILVILGVGGYGGYVYLKDPDSIKDTSDLLNKVQSSAAKDFEAVKKQAKNLMSEELLAGIEEFTKAAQEQLKAIANESEEDVRKDVKKYEDAQTEERKAEVKKEMEAIKKASKKPPIARKTKKIKTLEDALAIKIPQAKNDTLNDGVAILRSDVETREALYKKNKKKNKDQIDIAIAHARLAKQMLYKINENEPNQEATLETMRKVSTKIRSLVRLKNDS